MSFVFALHKTTLSWREPCTNLLKPWQPLVWQPYVTIRYGGEPEARFPGEATEEPWFQTEWKFADKAGKDLGLKLLRLPCRMAKKH